VTVNATGAGSDVSQAIFQAARKTGADFDYLLNTAARESGFDPRAEAPTSSAAGLFQFIEQTWLGMVKRHGARHGMAADAAQISTDASGRHRVDSPEAREAILNLRFDPEKSAAMAGEYTQEAAAALKTALGRAPGAGELYIAHFLGPQGARELIRAAEADPSRPADSLFPAAAKANARLFREDGQAVSVAALRDRLAALGGEGRAPTPPPAAAPANRPDAPRLVEAGPADRALARIAGLPSLPPGRVLSPGVIEALAELQAPERARRKT